MMRDHFLKLLTFTLLFMANSCGIDVGNPHGVTSSGDQGNLSIAIADAPADRARHVYLDITSMSVVPLVDDTTEGEPIAIELAASGKIDVLALQGGKSLDLSLAQAVPTGNYSAVILGLTKSSPTVLVDENGEEKPLIIPDGANEIRIQQTFQVVSSEHLALTLHLDLRRSIKTENGNFAFEPYASLGRRDEAGSILATHAPVEATEVCAYLRRDRPRRDDDHLQPPSGSFGDGQRPPPPPGTYDARQPPSVEPEGSFESIETDSSCARAFATEKITDRSFLLAHLWPGEYQLVFCKADGSPASGRAVPLRLEPAQKLEVDLESLLLGVRPRPLH